MTNSDETLSVHWHDYDRVTPGEYIAYCALARIYFDASYKRHTCLLVWNLLADDGENIATVRSWWNLGNKKAPSASRRSRYWAEWVRANEGRAPSQGNRLSPQIFKNRIARIVVSDTASSPPYSVASRILRWETGSPAGAENRHSNFNHSTTQVGIGQGLPQQGLLGQARDQRTSVLAGIEGEQTNHNPRAGGARNAARKGNSL